MNWTKQVEKTYEINLFVCQDNINGGINKKWKPGVKLTGNICCDVSGNTGDLMIELEYSEFLKTNVIYCYKLEDIEF